MSFNDALATIFFTITVVVILFGLIVIILAVLFPAAKAEKKKSTANTGQLTITVKKGTPHAGAFPYGQVMTEIESAVSSGAVEGSKVLHVPATDKPRLHWENFPINTFEVDWKIEES